MSGLFKFLFSLKNSIRIAKGFHALVKKKKKKKDRSYLASSKTLISLWERKGKAGGKRFWKGKEIKK